MDGNPNRHGDGLGHQRRAAASNCAWCGGPIQLHTHGPIPKWCSARCRKEAWAQNHAAASGRTAVTVVERIVHASALPPPKTRPPRNTDWLPVLHQLTEQLDTGLLYDRHLDGVAEAVDQVVAALQRRVRYRRR